MSTNYILIDFENVQIADLSALNNENFRVIVFVGERQTKILFETASSLQPFGDKVKYVKIAGNGPNALDFHIAFYLGQLTMSEHDTDFHIISKDHGFDPLIQHLKAKNISISRLNGIKEIPQVNAKNHKIKAEKPISKEERFQIVIDKIEHMKASKPRTVKTLSSTIAALFHKEISDDEIAAVISGMEAKKIITVTENKVTYALTKVDKIVQGHNPQKD